MVMPIQELERSDLPERDNRWGSGDKLASFFRRGLMELPGDEPEAGMFGQNDPGLPRFKIQTVMLAYFLRLRCFGAFFDYGPGVRLGTVIVMNIGIAHPQETNEKNGREDGCEDEISMHGLFSILSCNVASGNSTVAP